MTSASGTEAQHAHRGKFASWLAEVFQLNPAGLNWPRAVMFLDIALVPLVLFWAIGYEQYLLSALFGALFAWLADPGGSYGQRVSRVAIFAAIGTGLTALAYGIGGDAWGWLVLAASAVTLAASLAVMFGVRRYVNALLLNIWFIIALAVAFAFHHSSHHITQYTWAQTLAWTGGAALWIVVSFIAWLILGRQDQPQPIAEIPGDTSPRKLTPPIVMFAVLRTVVIAGTTAIAFGANPSHGLWLVVAAIIAMKPSLEQSTVTAMQRLAGALIGAGAAILLLLIPANVHGLHLVAVTRGLEVVALVLLAHAVATRFWNYAIYCAAIAAGVLTLMDLLQPTDYSAEGYRVLWTLCGVAIAALVMLLAGLLAKRTVKAPPQPPADVPAQRAAGQDLTSPTAHRAEPGKSAGRS
jgi:Fusaric acid resistance protein-like